MERQTQAKRPFFAYATLPDDVAIDADGYRESRQVLLHETFAHDLPWRRAGRTQARHVLLQRTVRTLFRIPEAILRIGPARDRSRHGISWFRLSSHPGNDTCRMYVRLVPDAIDTLQRSTQFKRAADNSIYHKGFPINYRGQGGVPSIQISIALDKRRADIDVDYRSSSFPAALFNGHLASSNSDVRAGNNYDSHLNRWTGFQNWWRGFFGVRQAQAPAETPASSPFALPTVPRAGKANIEGMINDFLNAWLVEGNIVAAMGYVSERLYACLARESDDPSAFDRGLAPFQLMGNMKSAYETLGPHTSLSGLVVGTRLVLPGLRVVQQPHHTQFVIYSVPDDVAASLDCESQLTLGDPKAARRVYGSYFGATFYVDGRLDAAVALLWGRDQGYWKIVSWRVGADDTTGGTADPVAGSKAVRVAWRITAYAIELP